jgi:hypothetical protein
VQIDSTVIDVPSRLLDGRLNRAELTVIHDVVPLHPRGSRASRRDEFGGSRGRARAGADTLRAAAARRAGAARAGGGDLDGQFMIDQERLDQHRLAQPYIFPETITTDNGKIYRSEAFRRDATSRGSH